MTQNLFAFSKIKINDGPSMIALFPSVEQVVERSATEAIMV